MTDPGSARGPLEHVLSYALEFEQTLKERKVGWAATPEELRAALDSHLPDQGLPPDAVIRDLTKSAEAGIVGVTSPRYFGFVIGGRTPATLAADWLTSVWDQNAGLYAGGPAATIAADIAGRWLLELFGLPLDCSFGFVTGCQMASFTGLAAARNYVLDSQGWNVEEGGLQGAPQVRVIAGAERHATIDRALRYLGLGTRNTRLVDVDDQGAMRYDAFVEALNESEVAAIVCTQAGNVNSGAFDPIGAICDAAHEHGSWVHVDGAFGLWAAVSDGLRPLVDGVEKADSWATDAHKWLNVPYDSGFIACAQPRHHKASMSVTASYLIHSDTIREEMDWVPEFSRRARSFCVYVGLKTLGRDGVTEVIERCCDNARLFAELLDEDPRVEVLNDVVLNQVLVRFLADDGDHDARTAAVVQGVQEDGTCWLSGSRWHDMGVMRISVTNYATTKEDVEMSAAAILRIAASK